MKKFFLLLVLLPTLAFADTPPPITTSKGSGDSSNINTINFQFPNCPITHTGNTASIGCGTGGGGGGVTSVGLALPNIFTVSGSPVTTTGTLTAVLATETANRIFAGPASGSAAAPTFRSIVAADLPALVYTVNGSTGTVVISAGSLDSQSPNASALAFSGTTLSTQSASATAPGVVNTSSQILAGAKEFVDTLTADNGVFSANGNISLTNGNVVVSNGFVETDYIAQANGSIRIDVVNQLLKDFQGYHRVDWVNGLLTDDSNVLSIDWDNRIFADNTGATQATISTAGLALNTGLAVQATGSDRRMGSAVLSGGTIVVSNASVTANTLVFLSVSTAGGTQGFLSSTKSNGTSFTINSSSVLDTSTVNWILIEKF